MSSSTNQRSLRIGVMMENVQLADVMGMDILGNLSMRHYEEGIAFDPSFTRWADHPVHMTFYYIGTTLDPTGASPDIKYLPNITYDDCPRDLDILIIGGPPPTHRPPQADHFMKEAWPKTRVWLVTCIGSMWLASTGLLNDKKSTTNRGLIPVAKRMYPEVDWVDQKWVVTEKDYDIAGGKGEIWTAGGAAAGIEMIAKYCLENFDPEFVQHIALHSLALDEYPLDQLYKS